MLKTLLMFSVAAGALLGAQAQAASFAYTGAEQTYDIATTGVYDFTAAGASGGNGFDTFHGNGFYTFHIGGLGARVEGMTTLTAGSTLDIFVGGAGGDAGYSAGGGGGAAHSCFCSPPPAGPR